MTLLRIANITLPIDHAPSDLRNACATLLHVSPNDIASINLVRRSVDARSRSIIKFIYTVDVALSENSGLTSDMMKRNKNVLPVPDTTYRFFSAAPSGPFHSPVIVGAGPAGLFSALLLARLGLRPILLERGKPVHERTQDVQEYWKQGILNPESNALYGEGGAGTFSDGKLATQIKDRENRCNWILRELVEAGAPEEVTYHYKPHIGTDNLVHVVEKIRNTIIALGGEVQFNACVSDLMLERGQVRGVRINGSAELRTDHVVLATGHSARDTYEMLHAQGVALSPKAFSIGARIEHPQSLIDCAQYGKTPTSALLGAADYRTVHHCRNGRSVYSFCMCPGGRVIGVGHEKYGVATNGMSYYARTGANANSGLLVGVHPDDFGDNHPLAGIAFQRRWEQEAYRLGGGGFKAPVQCVGDLLSGIASTGWGSVEPSYRPGVTPTDLRECLPPYVIEAWREAIPAMAQKLRGFDLPDAVLTGVETRSSSPVRLDRDPNGQSRSVQGLFPAGEGAGYAGGIISAAVDGMKAAEQIARLLAHPPEDITQNRTHP